MGFLESTPDSQNDNRSSRSRKRQRYEWKREAQKKARNFGQTYVTSKGKVVAEKKFSANFECKCRKKCANNIQEALRKTLFKNFWDMGSFQTQNAYLCGLVQQTLPSNRRPRNSSRPPKQKINHYRFQVEGNSVIVCKTFFLNTLQISDGRLTRALNKVMLGKPAGSDDRGRRAPKNKTSVEQMNELLNHINSFPSYQSHYTRAHNPNRRYLAENLNLRTMYNLYLEHCLQENLRPVKEATYRRTFNNSFNLHFHKPSKDTCSKCDSWKVKLEASQNEQERATIKQQHELHLRKAEAARESLKRDKLKAQQEEGFYAFTFDLEKALPFPVISTSLAYYKRNMYVYNLGCHEMETDLGYMYVWNETIASRGSQEIGSCISKHLQTRASTCKHVVAYSDACTGQNRNIKIVLFFMQLVSSEANEIDVIDHKFMVSGHSFLPNDSDYGSVETYARNKTIYVPEDWCNIITQCRRHKPFHLTKMFRKDFHSVELLEKAITRRTKNENNQPVNWLKIQWIRVVKEKPYMVLYKETLSEDFPFACINLKPKKGGRPSLLSNIPTTDLYSETRPVTAAKKKDMLDLLPYIPPIHHDFFRNLSTAPNTNDTTPLMDIEEEEGTEH